MRAATLPIVILAAIYGTVGSTVADQSRQEGERELLVEACLQTTGAIVAVAVGRMPESTADNNEAKREVRAG